MKKTTKCILSAAAILFLAVLWACRDEVVAPPHVEPISPTANAMALQTDSSAGVCDRTPQVRDAIMAEAEESDCNEVTTEDLASIQGLNLAGPPKIFSVADDCRDGLGHDKTVYSDKIMRGPCAPHADMVSADQTTNASGTPEIHALQDHDFEGLSGLRYLHLQDNWLVELPDTVFRPLDSLRTLDLSRNMLTALPDSVFDNLMDLESFRASGNRLARLPDGLFDASPALVSVRFSSNSLTELPDGLFDASPALQYASFSSNSLTELPDGLFDASPALQYAYFSSNSLTELPDGLFDASPALRYATFSYNSLTELPDGLFDASPALQYAYFSSNSLTELPDGLFDASPALWYASFSSNSLTELPDSLFDGTSSLRAVSFAFNQVGELPRGLLSGQPDLETVNFWSNKLTELPDDALRGLTELRHVDFDDNRLTELPDGLFEGLTSLNTVYFEGNPGSPFTLDLLPERVDNPDPLGPGPATVQLALAEAAPFSMSVAVKGVGGASLSNETIRFQAGDTVSSTFTVDVTQAPAAVVVDAPSPTPECEYCGFYGLEVATGALIVLANPPQATIKIAGAYITQAAQDLEGSVPLVAARDALLRVFATSDVVNNYKITGQATVYDRRLNEWTGEMTPPEGGIGREVDEGRLGSSFNLQIPGSQLGRGSTVLIRLIPDEESNLTDESELAMWIHPDVRDVAPLDVKVVPIQYGSHRNSGTNEIVARFARDLVERDSENQLQFARKLLPISSLNMTLREPYTTFADTTQEGGIGILNEIQLLRHLEAGGTDQYYHGLLAFPNFRGPGWGFGGIAANIPAYTALTISHSFDGSFRPGTGFGETFAHELGHDVSLRHAPGCNAGGPDRDFPHDEGTIGVWGYDVTLPEAGLKRPGTFDYMSYCDPTWVSDYYFAKSIEHLSRPGRGVQASGLPATQVLVLWGSVRDGDLRLEPPLALDAPVKRPANPGPYRLTGLDDGERPLFSFDFTPDETDHGGSVFVFAIPFERAWADGLDRIILSGPEGSRTVDRQAIDRAAVVVDRSTGRIRSIVRDWPQTLPDVLGDAAAVSVRRGLSRREETR